MTDWLTTFENFQSKKIVFACLIDPTGTSTRSFLNDMQTLSINYRLLVIPGVPRSSTIPPDDDIVAVKVPSAAIANILKNALYHEYQKITPVFESDYLVVIDVHTGFDNFPYQQLMKNMSDGDDSWDMLSLCSESADITVYKSAFLDICKLSDIWSYNSKNSRIRVIPRGTSASSNDNRYFTLWRSLEEVSNVGVSTTSRGKFYFLNNDESIGRTLASGIHWEDNIINKVSKFIKRGTVLDIGAHIGTHTIAYSRMLGNNGQVYCFEPQRVLYQLLLRNILTNDSSNIKPFNNCVGHVQQSVNMTDKVTDGSSSGNVISYNTHAGINYGGMQLGKGGEQCSMIVIDDLKLLDVTFMKVDVEGAESLVFYGAKETIKLCKPVILFEKLYTKFVTGDMREQCNVPPEVEEFSIEKYCQNLGYREAIQIAHYDFLLMPDHLEL